jgi:hypothetical protein
MSGANASPIGRSHQEMSAANASPTRSASAIARSLKEGRSHQEMIASVTGQLIVYVTDNPVDEDVVASVKTAMPEAVVLVDLLEPLYDVSIPTREAAHTLGKIKAELESMVEEGTRVVVLCHRRTEDLGTRAHFMASLCAAADRVHFLKST